MSQPLSPALLEVLACPQCRSVVRLARGNQGLSCEDCQLFFPIRNGIPVMMISEAEKLQGEKKTASETRGPSLAVSFEVVEGGNKGLRTEIKPGYCHILGRSEEEDMERTVVFSADTVVTLDESTRNLIVSYLEKQAGNTTKNESTGEQIFGGFMRGRDVRLNDSSISRLHVVLYHCHDGSVGCLDLVSKNGTFVNGAEIESKILRPGDLISIGGTKIRYQS